MISSVCIGSFFSSPGGPSSRPALSPGDRRDFTFNDRSTLRHIFHIRGKTMKDVPCGVARAEFFFRLKCGTIVIIRFSEKCRDPFRGSA